MLTCNAIDVYNDFVGIKVADFILTITLYIDKRLSLTTAIVSDRFSFAEEKTMEIKCTKEQKEWLLKSIENGYCPFDYEDEKGKDCKANENCRFCLNNRIKWNESEDK